MNIFIDSVVSFGWILDILYKICIFFDWLIYSVAVWLFNTFYDISKLGIDMNGNAINVTAIIERLKLFVGLFALFVCTKSLIIFIVNPSQIAENSKKIVFNIITSIVLLILSPFIFDWMNNFQASIFNQDTIPKLMLGVDGSGFDENAGQTFMGGIFTIFFNCGTYCDSTAMNAINKVRSGEESILTLMSYTDANGVYYEYPVISGIVGIVLCFYFFTFAIGLGVRIFKLFALQLLSPIPIIAYIDPKNKELCGKYFKLMVSVYVEVFIKLFVILLAYNLAQLLISGITISNIASSDSTGSGELGFVIRIILMLALFSFAKTLPDLLARTFGIDISTGNFKGLAKGFLGGAAGFGIGLAAGGITSKAAGLSLGDGIRHTLSSGVGGLNSGRKGAQQGLVGFGNSMLASSRKNFDASNQIYTSGGYGNYLKGQILNKIGYSSLADKKSEGLSAAVTSARQRYDQINGYQQQAQNLTATARQLFDQKDGGAAAAKVEAARQMLIDANKGKGTLSPAAARANYNSILSAYDAQVGSFYNNAVQGFDSSNEALTLKNVVDSFADQISSDVPGAATTLSSYSGINSVSSDLASAKLSADTKLKDAIAKEKAFKNKKIYKDATFNHSKDSDYKYR